MSFIAPAGTPLTVPDLALGLTQGAFGSGAANRLRQQLASHAAHQRCWLFSTGRGAMTLALTALREVAADPRRTQVIVAGYTCYSVPASVIKAGLAPRLADIDPRTLSPDVSRLNDIDPTRVLAIVSANLYGIPNALPLIEAWARQHGVFMLDDAAQALGASYGARNVGGFGDLGIYSFDKGKNITSLEGGAIVASGPLAAAIDRHFANLRPSSPVHTAATIAKLVVYSLLLRPSLYGVVQKLPFLGLGRTAYDDTFPVERYGRTLAGLTTRLYDRLAKLTAARTNNATRLLESLRDLPGIRFPQVPDDARPAWVRLPVRMDKNLRDRVLAKLQAAGIGATLSYPQALCDVAEVASQLPQADRNQPGAREVADTILTLPTHPYCPPDTAERVRACFLAAS